jgi:hypothetical protein
MKVLEKRRGEIKDALNFAPDPSVIELIPNLPKIIDKIVIQNDPEEVKSKSNYLAL